MSALDRLPTPALVLDLDVLENNVRTMAERADRLGVRLRPHVKTHKSPEVAEIQRRHGASGITVSTLYEAEVFANAGFDDITWAFPVIIGRLDEAVALAGRVALGLVVDSHEALDALAARAAPETPLRVWIKVDCGYHRAGVDPQSPRFLELAGGVARAEGLELSGILTHSGHAYDAADRSAMRQVVDQERSVMVAAAGRLRAEGLTVPEVSVGSTPAMCAAESLEGVTEARPGNYAFFDYMQVELGSCAARDVAVTVLSSVVSRMPDHSVVDAGALALSKDAGPGSRAGMGRILRNDGSGELEPDYRITSLSQEHGIVDRPLPVGTTLRIVPNHSCLTVACFDEYHVVRGGEVVDRWKVWRGR